MADEKKKEFDVEELEGELDDVAGGSCGGCMGGSGCANGGCAGCAHCAENQV